MNTLHYNQRREAYNRHRFQDPIWISKAYKNLIDILPTIFIGDGNKLKKIISLLCSAAKQSLNERGLHMPPWRTNSCMQSKWLLTVTNSRSRQVVLAEEKLVVGSPMFHLNLVVVVVSGPHPRWSLRGRALVVGLVCLVNFLIWAQNVVKDFTFNQCLFILWY